MEEKKRRNATKKRVEEYRALYAEYTDERLAAMVEELRPGKYGNGEEVALEVVKEMIRRGGEALTPESFAGTLESMEGEGWLQNFTKEAIAEAEKAREQYELRELERELMRKIYDDAQTGTRYLSKYPEYCGEIRERIEAEAKEKGKTVAQIIYYRLNDIAKYIAGDPMGYGNFLPFHCYSEPDGDVVFTTEKRTLSDYNADGTPRGSAVPEEDSLEAREDRIYKYIEDYLSARPEAPRYTRPDLSTIPARIRESRAALGTALIAMDETPDKILECDAAIVSRDASYFGNTFTFGDSGATSTPTRGRSAERVPFFAQDRSTREQARGEEWKPYFSKDQSERREQQQAQQDTERKESNGCLIAFVIVFALFVLFLAAI